MFSAVYIKAVFPHSKILIYGDVPKKDLYQSLQYYDFVFLPHYLFQQLEVVEVSLAINIASFQEMTTNQVNDYVKKLAEMKCESLYSLNRNRSRHNNQLTSVYNIMESYYSCKEIKVLDVPYTILPKSGSKSFFGYTKDIFKKLKKSYKNYIVPSSYHYRHLAGRLK